MLKQFIASKFNIKLWKLFKTPSGIPSVKCAINLITYKLKASKVPVLVFIVKFFSNENFILDNNFENKCDNHIVQILVLILYL